VSWVGLAPKVHQSGETKWTGRITRKGSKRARWILTQCAHTAKAQAFAKAGLGDDPRKWIDLYNPKTAEILELSRIIGSRSREDMAFTLLNWGTR